LARPSPPFSQVGDQWGVGEEGEEQNLKDPVGGTNGKGEQVPGAKGWDNHEYQGDICNGEKAKHCSISRTPCRTAELDLADNSKPALFRIGESEAGSRFAAVVSRRSQNRKDSDEEPSTTRRLDLPSLLAWAEELITDQLADGLGMAASEANRRNGKRFRQC
jgi:hypothetical protein